MREQGINFSDCEICGSQSWIEIYRGLIRDGKFPKSRDGATVARCGGCGVDRLSEEFCMQPQAYESAEYRQKLQQEIDIDSHVRDHDEFQIHTLKTLFPMSLRGKTIADIGSGSGSLLDHLSGISEKQIAVEPFDIFRQELKKRGYEAYPYVIDATKEWAAGVDVAFSIQVIEHLQNPKSFLQEVKRLLAPGARLIVSTPNREDILFDLLPVDFASFFYRVVHRWYFNAEALRNCARLAGFKVLEVKYVHRYGLSNTLHWLRDRSPRGDTRISGIENLADEFWSGYLSQTGRSDCLYAVLEPELD